MKVITFFIVLTLLCLTSYRLVFSDKNNAIAKKPGEYHTSKNPHEGEGALDSIKPENNSSTSINTVSIPTDQFLPVVLNGNSVEDVKTKLLEDYQEAEIRFLKESIDYEWSYNINRAFVTFVEKHSEKDKLSYELECRQTMCELMLFGPDFEIWNQVFNEMKEHEFWFWKSTYLNTENNESLTMILEK